MVLESFDYLMGTDRLRQIIARFVCVCVCFVFFVFFFVVVFVSRRMNNVDYVTFTIIFDQYQSLTWFQMFVKQTKNICLY